MNENIKLDAERKDIPLSTLRSKMKDIEEEDQEMLQ